MNFGEQSIAREELIKLWKVRVRVRVRFRVIVGASAPTVSR